MRRVGRIILVSGHVGKAEESKGCELMMDIVNSVEGLTGEPLVVYQVVYRPTEGFPAANELITNTTSAEECCIECQTTVSTLTYF
jgi:hypothetical protein